MSTTQAPGRQELLGHMPIIRTPYTRITEPWWHWQNGPCADAELEFAQCSARVGLDNVAKDCKQFHDDFMECAYRVKTMNRYKAMQAERVKQGRPYQQPPPPDSVRTWIKPF